MTELSIIVPVYNVESYLKETLDSLMSQTLLNWEAILVDDGSTDNSFSICEDYAQIDDRFKVFHRQNEGVSKTRNYALKQAHGKYIGFLDADDVLEPDYYDSMLQQIKSENADMVFSGYSSYVDGAITKRHATQKRSNIDTNHALEICFTPKSKTQLTIWNKIFLREILLDKDGKLIQFPDDLFIGEDAVWLVSVALNAKSVVISDSTGYLYRKNRIGSAVFEGKKTKIIESSISRYEASRRCFELTFISKLPVRTLAMRRTLFTLKDIEVYSYIAGYASTFDKYKSEYRKFLMDYISNTKVCYDIKFKSKVLTLYILMRLNINKLVISKIAKL